MSTVLGSLQPQNGLKSLWIFRQYFSTSLFFEHESHKKSLFLDQKHFLAAKTAADLVLVIVTILQYVNPKFFFLRVLS